MADEFREVTRTSWGQRILGSFAGALIGLLLFIGSFPLLWWGEGRSIDRIRTLDEGRGLVVSVSPDAIDAANEGKLVHTSGLADTNETLSDSDFGVTEKALKLKRTVEMYQWEEHKSTKTTENMGGSETTETVYSYKKEWSEKPIDSSDFKQSSGHSNPASMPYESHVFSASDIHVGAFALTSPFIKQITDFHDYPLSQKQYQQMDESLKATFKPHNNGYFSGDPANPQVGALRVRFAVVKPMDMSFIGKQQGGKLISYSAKNGSINLAESGIMDAPAMFASAESENTLITWAIRIGGFLLMWMGLTMVLRPISMMGAVVPIIGNIMGAGIGLACFVVTLPLSIGTIALAWLYFRPVIGAAVLLAGAFFFFGGVRMLKGKLARSEAMPEQMTQAM